MLRRNRIIGDVVIRKRQYVGCQLPLHKHAVFIELIASSARNGNGGSTLASNYTAPINVNRLNAPTNIRISYGTGEGQLGFDNVAILNLVPFCTPPVCITSLSYIWYVSGSMYSYVPHYTTIGNHTAKLYAVGDGYNNINSNNFTYTQVVKACLNDDTVGGASNVIE